MVSAALAETPADGLVIVGIHAPLFNVWNNDTPTSYGRRNVLNSLVRRKCFSRAIPRHR